MDRFAPFRDEALKRGVPGGEVERWIGTARPSVTLVSEPFAGSQIVGQLGGHPSLPDEIPHPGMSFAASLDCSAMPREATDLDLPTDGTLLIFAEPDIMSEHGPEVIHVPAGAAVAERPAPSEDILVFPRSDAHMVTNLTHPNRAVEDPAFPHSDDLAEVWWDIGYQMLRGDGPVQIGGFPWMEQSSPFESAAGKAGNKPEDWALLASWTPTDEEQFDEYYQGYAMMMIRREDLAARRYDRLHEVWDTSV